MNISEACRSILQRRPFLSDAMIRGILNYNRLAEELYEDILRKTGQQGIKLSTISMALRRIADKQRSHQSNSITLHLGNFIQSESSITYDLFQLTIPITQGMPLSSIITDIHNQLQLLPKDFLSISKGRNELTIITSIQHRKKIRKVIQNDLIKNESFDLAALSIKIPENSQDIPGLFYYFTRALAHQGISIIEMVSTFSELQFIFDEMVVNDAARVIRELVKMKRQ